MAALSRDHTRPRWACQAIILAGAACIPFLAACSASLDGDPVQTGSVTAVPTVSALQSDQGSDWDAVRRTVSRTVPVGAKDRVGWQNSDTGNSGTISDVIASSSSGKNCRNFSTTMSSIDGIRAYRAEVCREKAGAWEFTHVEAVDETEGRPKG